MHSTYWYARPGATEQGSKHSTAPEFGHGSNPPPDCMSVRGAWQADAAGAVVHGRLIYQITLYLDSENKKGQVQDIY